MKFGRLFEDLSLDAGILESFKSALKSKEMSFKKNYDFIVIIKCVKALR